MVPFIYYLYMGFNLITDSLKLQTYNRLHLLLFIFLFGMNVYKVGFMIPTSLTIISLVIGLLLENIRSLKIGAGDTKMVIVSSLFVLYSLNGTSIIIPFVIPVMLYLLFKVINGAITVSLTMFIMLYYYIRKGSKFNLKRSFEWLSYKITINKASGNFTIAVVIPATLSILISVIAIQLILRG